MRTIVVAVALAVASCHASYRPFDVADSCACGRDQ